MLATTGKLSGWERDFLGSLACGDAMTAPQKTVYERITRKMGVAVGEIRLRDR
jgi:hypothetical protein